jgi:flavin-dependent thymidylate synthase
MKVTLLTCTPDALDVLLYTKNTRLSMTSGGLADVKDWPEEKKVEELRYMRNTIQSSWEFVDYVFAIEGVTRAFTHQLVRHRVGTSFAQQAQRVVNMEGFDYLATGDALHPDGGERSERPSSRRDGGGLASSQVINNPSNVYDWTMQRIDEGYGRLLDLGVKSQDARGVLPTNILTNIVFKANLRTLHEMALKRLCVKAQGEFQDVFSAIVAAVTYEHTWADDFLRVQCAWNGTCLFPSLPVEQCHVKPWVYNPETAMAYGFPAVAHPKPIADLYQIHRAKRTEIQPEVGKPLLLNAGPRFQP